MLLEEGVGVSATKIKFWFWDILERQVNFGRGSRDLGQGGVKGRRRVKRKNMPRHLKNIVPQHNDPSRIF